MKECPKCGTEVQDNFDLCWNCTYSFSQYKIVKTDLINMSKRKVDCTRCNLPLIFSGKFKFHEGKRIGIFGDLFELFVNRESFDLYVCPKCGQVEFFTPLDN